MLLLFFFLDDWAKYYIVLISALGSYCLVFGYS